MIFFSFENNQPHKCVNKPIRMLRFIKGSNRCKDGKQSVRAVVKGIVAVTLGDRLV